METSNFNNPEAYQKGHAILTKVNRFNVLTVPLFVAFAAVMISCRTGALPWLVGVPVMLLIFTFFHVREVAMRKGNRLINGYFDTEHVEYSQFDLLDVLSDGNERSAWGIGSDMHQRALMDLEVDSDPENYRAPSWRRTESLLEQAIDEGFVVQVVSEDPEEQLLYRITEIGTVKLTLLIMQYNWRNEELELDPQPT